MIRSFSLGPAAAVTCSASGASGSGAADAIRRPDPSGSCGVAVRDLTASAAASVSTSMRVTFRSGPGEAPGVDGRTNDLGAYQLSSGLNQEELLGSPASTLRPARAIGRPPV